MSRFYRLGLVLLYMLTFCTLAEEDSLIPEFAQYQDAEKNLSPIVIECLDSEPTFDSLNCVALSEEGLVAVAGSSAWRSMVCVYSPQGTWLYGYKMSIPSQRGHAELFFTNTEELCVFSCYGVNQYAVWILDSDGLGVLETYSLPRRSTLAILGIETGDAMNVPRNARYRIYAFTRSKLKIQLNETEEVVTIVDFSEQYAREHQYDDLKTILFIGLITALGLGIVEFVYRKKAKE